MIIMQHKIQIKLHSTRRANKNSNNFKLPKVKITPMTLETAGKRSARILKENKGSINNNFVENDHQTNSEIADDSESIDVKSSPERRKRKNQLENLNSDLSPKYIGLYNSEGRRSRFNRIQKLESDDFLSTNIACFIRRTPPKLKQIVGKTNEHKFVCYESPIEKLIIKNKMIMQIDDNSNGLENINSKMEVDNNNLIDEQVGKENNIENENEIFEIEKTDNSDNLLIHHATSTPSTPTFEYDNKKLDYDNDFEINKNDITLASFHKSPSSTSTDSAKGSSIDMEIEFSTGVGEVFWGRVSSFPYWPCIVWPDPDGRSIMVNGHKTQKTHIKIHVRFFADNGRRGWVRKSHMMPYNGIDDFERRAEDIVKKYSKKHAFYRSFTITGRQKGLWDLAVSEAEKVAAVPLHQRTTKFEDILKESRQILFNEKRNKQSVSENQTTAGFFSGNSSKNTENNFSYPNLKRDRSPSLFEDSETDYFVKKRKIDLDEDHWTHESLAQIESILLNNIENENIFKDIEYKKFNDLIKSYILIGENESLARHLDVNLKTIWMIRQQALKDASNFSLNKNHMTMRKLSSRIKNIPSRTTSIENISTYTKPSVVLNEKEKIEKTKKTKKAKSMEEVIDDILMLQKNYLFRGLNREPVCKVCRKPNDLVKCSGTCQSWIHVQCSNKLKRDAFDDNAKSTVRHVTGDFEDTKSNSLIKNDSEKNLCFECSSEEEPSCFVCKKNNVELGDRIRCHINWCGKYFHQKCLKYWPQSKLTKSSDKIESLLCPGHVCHTCVSDDPRSKFLQIDKLKLAKCIDCPATYHLDSFCIPAGTLFLTATQIICPRHRKKDDGKKQNINANWCFICATGGSLICCETCPTAFHIECLKIPQPEGNYICEECETGRLPLYGELVWAKLSIYRWWPAIIIPPPEVPMNLLMKKHTSHEFCIRFFGSNDYSWISRNRVFLYLEGDWGRAPQTKSIDRAYKNGLEEAKKCFELIKAKKLSQNDVKDKRLTPLPYTKIKANRAVPPVKLQEADISELTSCDCDPNDPNACGLYSGCLNRLLMTECNPKACPAGPQCQNQLFEKRMYPSLKVNLTIGKGWGLVCEEEIISGTFVIEYVGEVIDDAEFKRRITQKQEEKDENYYFLTLEKDYMIDAGPKGNLARFMNHSCDPNCETQKWTVNGITRIGLFAIKDIPPNIELTFNYNLESIGDGKKKCFCGAPKCSGFIGVKYKKPEVTSSNLKKTKIKAKVKSIVKPGEQLSENY